MQSRNLVCRPSVYRIAKAPSSSFARNMGLFAPTPCYTRFPTGGDFAPLFRLLDDFAAPRASENFSAPFAFRNGAPAQQIFQPRFDVKEVESGYELRGELPGVDPKDVEVAFTNEQTLVIKGRTEREASSGSAPQDNAVAAAAESTEQAVVEPAQAEAEKDTEDAASDFSSSSYQKATVEDEESANTTAQPANATEAVAESSSAPAERAAAAEAATPKEPESRYWVSERSIGSFQRTFNFPSRVDTERVTANLKNGVLNLAIPKAAAPAARRIDIQ